MVEVILFFLKKACLDKRGGANGARLEGLNRLKFACCPTSMVWFSIPKRAFPLVKIAITWSRGKRVHKTPNMASIPMVPVAAYSNSKCFNSSFKGS